MTESTIDEVGRPEPPLAGDETGTLLGFLEYQRSTLEWKTCGLDDEQLRVRTASSAITLAGLLKHLAWVEDYWFSEVVAEGPVPAVWADADFDANPDWEWDTALDQTGDELRALWADRCAASRAVVDAQLELGPGALDRTHPAWGGRGRPSLRWVLVHMIEEYARHNGHADLLREAIDGETGE
ncbi:MAG: DinB family protein [Propionibacteriaceae bacterium]|nr:DinB family protein [Propionibacteriaceae bacterium]